VTEQRVRRRIQISGLNSTQPHGPRLWFSNNVCSSSNS